MLVTFFPFSSANTGNSIQVKADSNDRRRTWIQLSQGKQTTEIDDIQNIGVEDLRVIALYLSNYYTPFSTILNGTSLQYKTSDGAYDEEEMTAYQTNMTNALVNDLGFDKEAAQFLVSQTVNYTLKTAHFIYMRNSDLDDVLDFYGYEEKDGKVVKKDEGVCAFNYSGRSDCKDYKNIFYISSKKKYKESLDSIKAQVTDEEGNTTDETLYAVTYPIFLAALNMGTNSTATMEKYQNNFEGCSNVEFKGSWAETIDFYYVDTSNVAHTVFSNTDADVISYLLSNNELDYKNGLGNGFITVTQEYLKENSSKINLNKVIAPYQYIYVDWVGDLILDIGTGQLVLLPGCMNNHVFGYIDKSLQEGGDVSSNPLILTNAKAIYDMQEGYIVNTGTKQVATSTKMVGYDKNGKEYTVYTYAQLEQLIGKGLPPSALEAKIDKNYHAQLGVETKSIATTKQMRVYRTPYIDDPTVRSFLKGDYTVDKLSSAPTNIIPSNLMSKKLKDLTLAEFWTVMKGVGGVQSESTAYPDNSILWLDSNDGFNISLYLVQSQENGKHVKVTGLLSGNASHVCYTSDGLSYANMLGNHLVKTVSDPIHENDFKYGCWNGDGKDDKTNNGISSFNESNCNGNKLTALTGELSSCGIGIAWQPSDKSVKNAKYRVPQLVLNNGLSTIDCIYSSANCTYKLAIQGSFQITMTDGTMVKFEKSGISLGGTKASATYYTKENVELVKVEEKDDGIITTNTYSYKFKVGADTLIGCRYWTTALASSDKTFDKSNWLGTSDTMQKVYDYLNDNGFTCGSGKDRMGFPYLNFWLTVRHSKTTTSYSDTVREKYKDKYVSADLCDSDILTMSEVLFYDNLEEVNEDTTLCGDGGLFKAVDVYGVATGKNAEVDKSSLQSTSIFKTTAFDSAIESISGGGNSKLAPCLFYTYVFGYFNKDATEYDETINGINMKLCFENFPTEEGNIDWTNLTDTTGDEIMSFIYYLLHPSKGAKYVATLFKNKVSGILLGWHEDIVGSSDSNSTTGMTRYLGFTGYVTIPTLNDISWVATLLANYNNIIVYLIILMSVVMLCYVLTGSLSIQRGILGVLVFAIFAFLPPVAINTVVNVTNTVDDKLYSQKFDYWALVQMQQYILELDKAQDAKSQGDMTTYANFIISNYTSASTADSVGGASETGYSGVKVKWISPKKYNVTANLSEAMDSVDTDANYLKNILLNSVANQISGESYLDSDSALYLYRDYLDIYRYGSCSYNIYTTFNYNGQLKTQDTCKIGARGNTGKNSLVTRWADAYAGVEEELGELTYHSGLPLSWTIMKNADNTQTSDKISDDLYSTTSLYATKRGWLWNNAGYKRVKIDNNTLYDGGVNSEELNYYNNETTLATSLLLNYASAYKEVAQNVKHFKENVTNSTKGLNVTFESLTDRSLVWGIDANKFNYDIQNILGQKDSSEIDSAYENLSYFYWGLYTESPFYFFSFNIQDQLTAAKLDDFNGSNYKYDYNNLQGSTGNIKALFLGEKQKYFFNLENTAGDGYGEMRDYMNMHDFFYYIIPTLRQGTDLVREFDDLYGMYTYDDCPLKFLSDGTFVYGPVSGTKYTSLSDFSAQWKDMNDEERYKFWHDYNVNTLFNQYAAWIDTMMDCEYAKPEEIQVAGKKFKVDDPLDPTSYFTFDKKQNCITGGRYMVFSRSEMKYYGLDWADLTKVEQKIITIQDNVYEQAIDLMNYYTLSDETLIQAYAMIQLFEFDKEFSQTSFVKDDYILYPQSYELKAFTYDAYLRLILSGSTGEDLMTTGEVSEDDTATTTNVSIYERILNNTSLFFGLVLLINDFVAVYVLPAFKLFFLILIFFMSILLIVSASIKLETPVNAFWKSLLAPMLTFSAISIGMAWLISKFMSEGAQGVVQTSQLIQLGDPTMVIVVILVINIIALVLYFKILKKCWKDFIMYLKAVFASIGGALAGAVATMAGVITAGKVGATAAVNGASWVGGKAREGIGKAKGAYNRHQAATPEQRSKDNDPKSGKNGLGAATAGGVAGAAAADAVAKEAQTTKDKAKTQNYDAKAANKPNTEGKKDKKDALTLGSENKFVKEQANGNYAMHEQMMKSNPAYRKHFEEKVSKDRQAKIDKYKADKREKLGLNNSKQPSTAVTQARIQRRLEQNKVKADKVKKAQSRTKGITNTTTKVAKVTPKTTPSNVVSLVDFKAKGKKKK